MNVLQFQLAENELIFISLGVLLFVILVFLLGYALKKNFIDKTPTFQSTLQAYQTTRLAILIHLLDDKVEKYDLTTSSVQVVTFTEFCYSLDATNVGRLKEWLTDIKETYEFGARKRKQIIMYDSHHKKRVFRFVLQNYYPETQKYFMTAEDITESSSLIHRYNEIFVDYDAEKFYELIRLYESEQKEEHTDCICFITYREFLSIDTEVKGDLLKLLDFAILGKLEKVKNENEHIGQYKTGKFLLHSPQVTDMKLYKKHIKEILSYCSGMTSTVKKRFDLNFVCGVTVLKNEPMSSKKILEAELAAEHCMKKVFSNDKIMFFNEELSKKESEKNQKMQTIQKIIEENLLNITYTPIINKDWQVIGYSVNFTSEEYPNFTGTEIFNGAGEMGIRKVLVKKILNDIVDNAFIPGMKYFFNFEYQHLARVYQAYIENHEYAQIDLVFALDFTKFNYDESYRNIETKMASIRKNTNIQLAITTAEIKANYLTRNIYRYAHYYILKGKLVQESLDTFYNKSSLELQTRIAKSYQLELCCYDVKNIDQLEYLYTLQVQNFSGNLLTPKILKGEVNDKQFLKDLEEIKQRG